MPKLQLIRDIFTSGTEEFPADLRSAISENDPEFSDVLCCRVAIGDQIFRDYIVAATFQDVEKALLVNGGSIVKIKLFKQGDMVTFSVTSVEAPPQVVVASQSEVVDDAEDTETDTTNVEEETSKKRKKKTA